MPTSSFYLRKMPQDRSLMRALLAGTLPMACRGDAAESCLTHREGQTPWHSFLNRESHPGSWASSYRHRRCRENMLTSLPCTVGISLAGSLFFICSIADKKPRVLWETGRPYLPSQATSPAFFSFFAFFSLASLMLHDTGPPRGLCAA